jgi:hypothetical protein
MVIVADHKIMKKHRKFGVLVRVVEITKNTA